MNEQSIKQAIRASRKRKKEFERMLAANDMYILALRRSIATEILNIAEYEKNLKEQRDE